MATSASSKVVFELDGVFIHYPESSGEQNSLISGCLRLLDKDGDVIVEYNPVEDEDLSAMLCAAKECSNVFEWGQVKGRGPTQGKAPGDERRGELQMSYETEWDMVQTVQFRKSPWEGASCSTPAPAPDMSKASKSSQLKFRLSDLASVKVKEEGWSYLVFTLRDAGVELPALHFHQGGSEGFLGCLRKHVQLTESASDASVLLVSSHSKALSQSFENLLDDAKFGLLTKFSQDPVTTTLGGFSKVTNYLIDAFRVPDTELQHRPAAQVVDLLNEVIPGLDINQLDEPGFEVITRVDLGERPEVRRGEPLGLDEWNRNMDPDGRMRNVVDLKHTIFKGGLCHAARKDGWKFLLGYMPWDSTVEDRRSLTTRKTDEYFRMKLQWKSVSEDQEKRNSRLRDHRSLIEKDVKRTDRTNPFYEGADNPGLILLHDVLMTYCMYDFDLGYVQGMSDLLSPILYVMENEVDAFWCFVSYMEQMHQNFEEQMQGMKTQLMQLSTLLRLLDVSFWNYLGAQESGHLYFCFRWLLIRFKRELNFHDVLRLWEVMWTGLPCQNFHLLVCCAILDSEKQKIMEEQYSFNEILKHINELSMKLDIRVILQKAEAICLQLRSCKDLPSSVGEILGLNDTETQSSSKDRPRIPEYSTPSEDQQQLIEDYSPSSSSQMTTSPSSS
ncbi:hypothetical protein UPYG_G00249720 [Umbra pygmaea]|uniref:TBC1 domain family member 15 n=1 Tax=Umbra pygmaea TaxID=75934 RepID=A0ABD0WX65_UMBPY